MANIKFSGFTEVTNISGIQEIVGYNGVDNVRITPANFVTSGGTGVFLPLAGGIMTGPTVHNDNVKSFYGTNGDFEIFYNGTNALLDNYNGSLRIRGNTVRLESHSLIHNFLIATESLGVQLFFNNVQKFVTTSVGVSIAGGVDTVASISGTTGSARLDIKTDSHNRFLQTIEADGRFRLFNETTSAEQLSVLSNGNVGINSVNPVKKLHVVDTTGSFEVALFQTDQGGSLIRNLDSTAQVETGVQAGKWVARTSSTARLAIDTAGLVGIGTTTPVKKLDIVSTTSDVAGEMRLAGILASDDLPFGKINFANTAAANSQTDDILAYIAGEKVGSSNRGELTFATSNDASPTEKMRIDSAGNVGIGTTDPGARLDIIDSGLATMFRLSNTEADATTKNGAILGRHYTNAEENVTGMLITSNSSTTGGSVSIGGGISSANAVNNILFYTAANNTTLGGSERMRIEPNGNLRITDVIDNLTNSLTLNGRNTGEIHFQAGTVDKMRMMSNGRFGVGTTSPDALFQVDTTDALNTAIFENSGQTYSFTAIKVAEALNNKACLTFVVGDALASTDVVGEISGLITSDGTGNALTGEMTFKTNPGDNITERMRITAAGGISFGSTGTAYGTSGQVLTSAGNATPVWAAAAAAGGVSGSNSVYVTPTGTAAQNGVLLLSGLTSAIAKISSVTVPGSNVAMQQYQPSGPTSFDCTAQNNVTFSVGPQYQATFQGAQVLITVTNVGFQGPNTFQCNITTLAGGAVNIFGSPDFPSPASTQLTPSTLIIAPGDYSIASDFILNNLVNVTSLTGQADVNITTSNVKIQSGANSSSNPISIVGLNLTTSLFIQSNLSSLNFKNCKAIGTNSFSIEPSGTGSIAGTFEDCTGDFRSFGGGVGVTASGLFIRCKTTGNGAFGGKGSTSGYFEYCGGAIYASGSLGIFHQSFGTEGLTVNGYFYYCTAGNSSFASENTGATGAEFYYCYAKNTSFAYRNTNNDAKFYNCIGGNQVFGSNALSSDAAANARYYNCTMTNGPKSLTTSARYINCNAETAWLNDCIVGNNGLLYNCFFGGFSGGTTPTVTGTGKIRNCLDNSYTLINLG